MGGAGAALVDQCHRGGVEETELELAMKLKTIRVTQDDIDHGKRGSFCDCPVALAVKRAFRASLSDRRIAVRHEGIFVGDLEDERFWVAEADREVQAFIAAFDDGKRVTPRTFDMAFR